MKQILLAVCRVSLVLFKASCTFVATVLLCVLIYGVQVVPLVCGLTNNFIDTLECSHASEKLIISTEDVFDCVLSTKKYNLQEIVEPRIVQRTNVRGSVGHTYNELIVHVAGKPVRIPTDHRPIEEQHKSLANFLEDPKSQDYKVEEFRTESTSSLRQLTRMLRESVTYVLYEAQQRTGEMIYSVGLKAPLQSMMQVLQERASVLAKYPLILIWLLWVVCVFGFFGLCCVAPVVFEKVSEWTRQLFR